DTKWCRPATRWRTVWRPCTNAPLCPGLRHGGEIRPAAHLPLPGRSRVRRLAQVHPDVPVVVVGPLELAQYLVQLLPLLELRLEAVAGLLNPLVAFLLLLLGVLDFLGIVEGLLHRVVEGLHVLVKLVELGLRLLPERLVLLGQ